MPDKQVDLRRKKLISRREIIVIVLAVALTTAGIKAADKFAGKQAGDTRAPCPKDMVLVQAASGEFCIDKYEVSPAAECPYPTPDNQGETRMNLDYADCQPVSVRGAKPWRYISQDQARIACAKAGKRLPTNKEWFAAALGTPDESRDWGPDDCQVAGNWQEQPGPAGAGKNCVSAAGAYDMIGNVWEWVKGATDQGVYKGKEMPASGFVHSTDGASLPAKTDPDQPDPNYRKDYFWIKKEGVRGMARGGYWNNKTDAGQFSVYVVTPPSGAGAGTGFRCVSGTRS